MPMLRLAVVLSAANLLLLLFLLARPASPSAQSGTVLRGQALELVNAGGQTRASLRIEEPAGEIVFRLMDQQGRIRVKLGASGEGSGLLLANDTSQPGIHMLAKREGVSIALTDIGGRQIALQPQ
jgi:hypothetical protein